MSYRDYREAMALAPRCRFYTTAGGKSEAEIRKSEELLGITFSGQCREFYASCGYLSFGGNEIFGIDPEDDSGILSGNTVAYALHDRREYGLPEKWLPVLEYEDGILAYLDYSSLNEEGEPPVITAGYDGSEYRIEETVAEDLGAFLLRLITQQPEG